jgi:hypothetical protein
MRWRTEAQDAAGVEALNRKFTASRAGSALLIFWLGVISPLEPRFVRTRILRTCEIKHLEESKSGDS